MKKVFAICATCAIAAAAMLTACDPEEKIETPAAPTGLTATNPTTSGATLSWAAVTGAESYQVRIDDGSPVTVTATTYTATGFAAETTHSWDVRVVKGSIQSAWSTKGMFTTAAEPAGDPQPLATPTGLAHSEVTENSATLTWNAVEGAQGYEVKIDDDEPIVLLAVTSCTLIDLTAETTYNWTVRATTTDPASTPSDWAEADSFTTEALAPVPASIPIAELHSWGDYYNNGTHSFALTLREFDIWTDNPTPTGYHFTLELITPPIDDGKDKEYIDIPAGTYTFGDQPVANTLLNSYNTYVNFAVEGEWGATNIESGSVTISGDHTNYTITANLTLTGDITYLGQYTGPIELFNPKYVEPTEPADFGALPGEIVRMPDYWWDGTTDQWIFEAYGDGISVDEEGYFSGSGWLVMGELFTEFEADPIPDGQYELNESRAPGSALSGYGNSYGVVGTVAALFEDGEIVDFHGLDSGSITAAFDGTGYQLAFATNDLYGSSVTGSVYLTPITLPEPEYVGGGRRAGAVRPAGARPATPMSRTAASSATGAKLRSITKR